jgi:hypothetical protein
MFQFNQNQLWLGMTVMHYYHALWETPLLHRYHHSEAWEEGN